MYLNETHPLNKKALEYLARGKKQNKFAPIAAADSVSDPYREQGSHPEAVEQVWDVIGASLPEDCHCLLYGTPALVHPKTGIILAFCNGTSYCIRLTEELVKEALKAGFKTYVKWTYGGDMDTLRDLGSEWVFGKWSSRETSWCAEVYKKIESLET